MWKNQVKKNSFFFHIHYYFFWLIMITTVVGSFPIEAKEPNTISDKIKKPLGLYDPYKKAIE